MVKQLVVQLARFGDIIQAKRLILSLCQLGEVHLCVDKSLQDLARMIYPDLPLFALPGPGAADAADAGVLEGAAATLETLRLEHYDAVYMLNHAGLNRALAAMFDPAVVRGYIMRKGQSLKSNWVRMAFRWMQTRDRAPLNLVDYWAGLAPRLCPPDRVNPPAKAGGRGLGVVLAGQNARRSLPPEVLAPVIHAVFERLGGPQLWLLGGQKDRGAGRELLGLLPSRVAQKAVNLAGRTNWKELAAAVQGLDLLLSPDTGVMHLAAHLGTPVEGLFLSSAWGFETGPYGRGHTIWQARQACSPCLESASCPFQVRCRSVFAEPAFLARLQGKEGKMGTAALSGMLKLDSDLDRLGLVWRVTPEDPWMQTRSLLRGTLAEYLGIIPDSPGVLSVDAAQTIYQEADWVLPRILP